MARRVRKIELFTEGDPLSWKAILLVRHFAVPNCEIAVLDIRDPGVPRRAAVLGIHSLPSVAIDGKPIEVDISVLERDLMVAVRVLRDMDSWRLNLELAKERLRTALEKDDGPARPFC